MKTNALIVLSCLFAAICSCAKNTETGKTVIVPESKKAEISSMTIIGNSIVRHPVNEDLGWHGDWGMAASSEDKDMVHLIQAQVKAIAPDVSVKWSNIGSAYERDWKTYDLGSDAIKALKEEGLLIVKIQENVVPANGTSFTDPELDQFIARYEQFLGALSGANTKYIVCGGFWSGNYNNAINKRLKAFAKAKKYPFVDLDDMFAQAKYRATEFSNPGVANHPGDAGMAEIAKRIMAAINENYILK